jgi:hypothetical protein
MQAESKDISCASVATDTESALSETIKQAEGVVSQRNSSNVDSSNVDIIIASKPATPGRKSRAAVSNPEAHSHNDQTVKATETWRRS